MHTLYTAGPREVPLDLTLPTKTYKMRAWLALASLALFVVLYIALAAWFVWTANRLIRSAISGGPGTGIHFLIGAGAAFLAIFMLKALVFIKRGGAPDAVEVTAAGQPRLFEFLYRLADETGAPRPKRVYLSAQVNAAVFYDLSILNLLFPSRKNLDIGLALVNVLSLSEFKAVLAHEFGHFAQRSMAVGSWVYIAQQITEHIVAKRDALDRFLSFLSNIDFRIAWIGWLLSLVVWSIRSLMDTLLKLVVLAQRALSRQMEFQADLVAVSLTGSDELVHALHKLNAADEAWARTLAFTDSELQQERMPHDLFAVQTRIIHKTAQILADESYGQVPDVAGDNPEARRIFKSCFAQPPHMWSTHPANVDREENAKSRYLPAPHDPRSAWLLFDDLEAVKAQVIAPLLRDVKAVPLSADVTFSSLDERYSRLRYDAKYRGAYLGRSLTRHVGQPDDLYGDIPSDAEIQPALDSLYPARLGDELARLRELSEERITLEALHDKVFRATGGRIVHRGREISRGELPAAIKEVEREEERARQDILEHDRRCRGAHLAAADRLGFGWKDYLTGLLKVLHYAEHAQADLIDARGAFDNVFQVVTADGKVSKRELKRLVDAANMLHAVLAAIYNKASELQLDQTLCAQLEVTGWPEMLEEFRLSSANNENIGEWLKVIDGWVDSAAAALGSLAGATLEQLLRSEDEVSRLWRARSVPPPATAASRTPTHYSKLLPGQERKRQKRLGAWDRFQTADGLVPALARFLVAVAIVGTVLGFGGATGTVSVLAVYNGLGLPVTVLAGNQRLSLAPFTSTQADIKLDDACKVEARTIDGRLIESFTPPVGPYSQHYVYNVAGASPLVEWTAVYGSALEQPPRFLGAPHWLISSADYLFTSPPESVKAKSGATRTVLSAAGDHSPTEILELIKNEDERTQVILAHAKWDPKNTRYGDEWRKLAK